MIWDINEFILIISLGITISIVLANILMTKIPAVRHIKPFWEFFWRLALPLAISILWSCYTWHPFALFTFISPIVGSLLFLIQYETELGLGYEGLQALERYLLIFYRFNQNPEVLYGVKLYTAPDITLSINDILLKIREEIEIKEVYREKEKEAIIKQIDQIKETIGKSEIFYYFYMDYRQFFRGLYCIIYITDRGRPNVSKIEGICLDSDFSEEMFNLTFKFKVVLDAKPTVDLLAKLYDNIDMLVNVFAHSKDVKLIPVLKLQLEEANKRTKQVLDAFKETKADNYLVLKRLGKTSTEGSEFKRLIKYSLLMSGLFAGSIIAIVLILVLLGGI